MSASDDELLAALREARQRLENAGRTAMESKAEHLHVTFTAARRELAVADGDVRHRQERIATGEYTPEEAEHLGALRRRQIEANGTVDALRRHIRAFLDGPESQ